MRNSYLTVRGPQNMRPATGNDTVRSLQGSVKRLQQELQEAKEDAKLKRFRSLQRELQASIRQPFDRSLTL
jgi:uncharacterized membrane protein (DUF106 family)